MYIYLYDSFLEHKKYHKIITKIETRITDLGLNGKIVRLTPLNSISNTIESELKFGAKTIIGLGNNLTLNKIINSVTKSTSNQVNQFVTVGFIPIGSDNSLATCLGINSINSACDIISNRRTKLINLGVANIDNHFLTEAIIENKNSTVEINENYTLETSDKGNIRIINLPLTNLPFKYNNNPTNNKLELFIEQKSNSLFKQSEKQNSLMNFNKLRIINKNSPIILDNCISIENPTDITLSNKKIKLILGKNRSFI